MFRSSGVAIDERTTGLHTARSRLTKRGASTEYGRQRLRVCCLPIAGRENPYQHLMMEGLRQDSRLEVMHGAPGKFFAAVRTVVRHRPDIIHYDWIFRYFMRRRNWWTWLNAPLFVLEIWLVRYVLGTRIVWTMHNLGTHDVPLGNVELWVRRRFAKMCEWIRVFGERTIERASTLLGIPGAKFIVLPEGSYVDYYPNQLGRDDARRRLGIAEDRFVLLSIGGIRPYKGVEKLIDNFKRKSARNWLLLIAGKPHDLEYAQRIKDVVDGDERIQLHLKFIPDDELQLYFNACDVVVLPFERIENSGSVVLAMGFAKPVIAPTLGVVAERLGNQAELLYTHDPAEALEKLASIDTEDLQQLGRMNYEAVARHTWKDFSNAFGGVVANGRAGKA